MKSSVVTLLCRLEITVGIAATRLGNLNAMGILDPKGSGVKWRHLITKGKVGMVTVMDSRVKAAIGIV